MMKNLFGKSQNVCLSLVIGLLALTSALGQQSYTASTAVQNGLQITTFNTPEGKITVKLPSDMAAGDVISGTIVSDPMQDTKGRPNKNVHTLNGYVVDLEEQSVPVQDKKGKWTLPEKAIVDLILRSPNGKEVSRTIISLPPAPANSNPNGTSPGFQIPDLIVSGQPARITGSFDGSYATSDVFINGQYSEVIAESPRSILFNPPEGLSGQGDLSLLEQGDQVSQKINIAVLTLSADRLDLLRGESTRVHVYIRGLQGLEKEVVLYVNNLTSSKIHLQGGNSQAITISPDELSDDGQWQRSFIVKAISPGSFSISAELDPDREEDRAENSSVEQDENATDPLPSELTDDFYIFPNSSFAAHLSYSLNPSLYFDFVNDLNLNVQDFNTPRKYKFDPDRVTRASNTKDNFNKFRKDAEEDASGTASRVNGTENTNRKELKGTVGFRVYYTQPDKWGCYWIHSSWFSWKEDVYYENQWKTDRKLVNVLRFNDIKADVNGSIEMTGTVSSGVSVSGSLSVPIPKLPGSSVGISITPPSTSTLKASGEMKGEISGYLNGKSMVIYLYYDEYHVERASRIYFWRLEQKYCGDNPTGPVTYKVETIEKWEKYTERKYYADVYLVVDGITHDTPDGPKVHTRVEKLSENQYYDYELEDLEKIKPEQGQDPSKFFKGIQ